MLTQGERGTPNPNEDDEHKKWVEEQERLKKELKSLMSSEVKKGGAEKKSDKAQEDLLFEKAMGKLTGDAPKGAATDMPLNDEAPPQAAHTEAPGPAPGAEPLKEEPAEEGGPAPEVKREIPKPKDLAEKLDKVMAAQKKVEKKEEMEEEPAHEPKREIPKPRGLADMIGKVMAAERKPETEKVPKKVDYTRFAAKEIGFKGKVDPVAPSKQQLAQEPAPQPPSPTVQRTPQPGTVVKQPEPPAPQARVPVKQPVSPIHVKQPVAPVQPAPTPPGPQPTVAKDELGEEPDPVKDAQFEEGIVVKDGGDTSIKSVIEHTEGLIAKAPEYIDLSRPKKLIHKAKEALAEGDPDEANKLAQEARQKIIEIRNDFINAKKLLKLSKERLLTAKDKGYNINKAKSHYQMALKLLKKNDHIMSMQYAKLCLREIERNEMGI